jgi:hypothetical protein
MRCMRRRTRIPHWLWWLLIGTAVVAATFTVSLQMASTSNEDWSEATSLATGMIGLVLTAVTVSLAFNQRRARDEESTIGELAKLQFRRIGEEIDRLGLSGDDFIDVAWSYDDADQHTTVKARREPNDFGTARLGLDWLEVRPRLGVVLGGKGSGKSVTTMLLTHQLLHLRHNDREGTQRIPVPVLLHIGEWDPENSLLEWAAAKLTDQFGVANAVAENLVHDGDILLVLDGFDEIPRVNRTKALKRLRKFLTNSHCSVVLASRIAEYEAALKRAGRFPSTAVITLGTVGPEQAKRFLLNGTQPDGHWDPIMDLIDEQKSSFAKVLQSPLMVYLCSEVYKHDRPDRVVLERLQGQAAVERHLLSAYLPAQYDGNANGGPRYDHESAIRWLRSIAHHLEQVETPRFAWWELIKAIAPEQYRVTTGIVAGLVSWPLMYFAFDPVSGVAFITLSAVVYGWVFGLMSPDPRRDRGRERGGPQYLTLGRAQFSSRVARFFAYPLLLGIPVAALAVWLMSRSVSMVVATAGYMMLFSLIAVLSGARSTHQLQVLGPRRVLSSTRIATATMAAISAVAVGLIVWAFLTVLIDYEYSARAGLAFGLISMIPSTLRWPATWQRYRVAHLTLAFSKPGRLPVRLMRFLDDAHKRGVLRQVGATYEFRHGELQAFLVESNPREI